MERCIYDDEIIIYRQILNNYLKLKFPDAHYSDEEKDSLAERALAIMRRDEINLSENVVDVYNFLLSSRTKTV